MLGATTWGVSQRESLITAVGFDGDVRIGVMFGSTEGPLIMQCPYEGHLQPSDLLDRQSVVAQPMQVHEISFALAVVVLQLCAKPSSRPSDRVRSQVLAVKSTSSKECEARMHPTPDLALANWPSSYYSRDI
jgi:hypothetical protein